MKKTQNGLIAATYVQDIQTAVPRALLKSDVKGNKEWKKKKDGKSDPGGWPLIT